MHPKTLWLLIALFPVTGCGAPTGPTDQPDAGRTKIQNGSMPASSEQPSPALPAKDLASATPAAPLSCSAEIGAPAAAQRVAVCRNLSPATHPPCNAANSCALIENEIARSCALFEDDDLPAEGCDPAPKSAEAAAAVVRRYYSAINAHDYTTAWSQWGDEGRPGQTFAAFEAGFAQTRSTNVAIGTLEPGEGAAGSIYQPIPVTVDAMLNDGTRQRFRGSYVVRRVNDVDGASPAQLRWHIDSAQLERVPQQ